MHDIFTKNALKFYHDKFTWVSCYNKQQKHDILRFNFTFLSFLNFFFSLSFKTFFFVFAYSNEFYDQIHTINYYGIELIE